MAKRRCSVWTVALLLVAACDISSRPDPPQRTQDPPDTIAACSHAAAATRTNLPPPVAAMLAPTVGPLSFHIDEYTDGSPTKVVIRPKKQLTARLTLTGSRCSDGLPLLFWFEEGMPGLPTAGDATATLEPAGADVAYTGYLLFTAKGRWEMTIAQAGTSLGVLLIEVG